MRSTPQPSRREGSTTDGPGCDLAITPTFDTGASFSNAGPDDVHSNVVDPQV
jgi:hypothetical protein